MSDFDDFVTKQAESNEKIALHLEGLSTDIKTLQEQVQALKDAEGTLTPAQTSALNTLAASSANLADRAEALDSLVAPPAVVEPTPLPGEETDPVPGDVAG